MANDDIQEKRLRARLALEGDERHAKREQSEAEVAKLRQEAMLAMEGGERKAAREAKLKAEQDQIENEQKRLAEIDRLRQLEAARKKAEEDVSILEKDRQEKIRQEQFEKIHQAEAKIENLKQSPVPAITSIRTLQSDLAQSIERHNMSATSIAVQNQAEINQVSFAAKPKSPTKTIITLALVGLLIGAGLGALWYAKKITSDQTVPLTNLNVPKLVTAENTEVINLTTSTSSGQVGQIKTEIRNKLATTKNGITAFYFTTQTPNPDQPEKVETTFLSPTAFASLAQVAIPDGVLRTVDDIFTLGTINDNTHATFIIMQIKDLAADRALARMFDWEETMATDLTVLRPAETTATTSRISFVDKRVDNLDTRILYTTDNQPILAYAFFNNRYIIIATTDTVISDLVARLVP